MRISIVVPVYNPGRELLSRCIDSLQRQTWKDLEILLVDDGSTDDSGRVCDEYAQRDSRIQVIHKSNGGEATARNAGLEQSSGEFVCFCDSDDELTDSALSDLAKAAGKTPPTDLVISAYLEKTGGITRIAVANRGDYSPGEAALEAGLDTYAYGSCYIFSTVNGKLFHRETIDRHRVRFQEDMKVGNDTVFMRDYLLHCVHISNIFLPTYIYYKYDRTQRSQGTSWLYPDWFLFICSVWEKDLEIIRKDPGCSSACLGAFYQRMIDTLIGSLVMAAAYEAWFPYPIEKAIAAVIQSDFVSRAIRYYQPVRVSDSVQIPKCIAERDVAGLMAELRTRAGAYIKAHGTRDRIRFIYPAEGNPFQ